jgi:hypothetical protein
MKLKKIIEESKLRPEFRKLNDDELDEFRKTIAQAFDLKESVNEGLPPGYSKFLVSLQTLIGDIAPNAWGNKSQITPSSVKRVHNSLKKRYGDDYAKFNDLLKTQKGQFGNWYLKESVNEAASVISMPEAEKVWDALVKKFSDNKNDSIEYLNKDKSYRNMAIMAIFRATKF